MPHLRFTRDKRGYETTALLTSGGGRRRSGRQQRVLYYFRTPPGVRVGRAPIDEDAIHLLEQHNPDVQFDWTRILKQPQEQGRREDRREDRRDRRREERRHPAAGFQPPAPGSQLPAAGSQLPADASEEIDPELLEEFAAEPGPPEAGGGQLEADSRELEADSRELEADSRELEADSRELEAGSRELEAGSRELEAGSREPETVPERYARLGSEGLARLRARYAEVMARIADRPLEEDAREQLKSKAERLNPDGWVTVDEVAAALEQYETVFEELRAVVGRQPRRHRRRRV